MNVRIHYILLLLLLAYSTSANATNGYFQIGYGPQSRALVGATTALPQDSLAAATNPAGMAIVDASMDFALELFSPRRSASGAMGGVPGSSESDSDYFLVPNFGYVTKMGQRQVGISIYANGGMNTDYPANLAGPSSLFGAPGELGVNLRQLIFAPTLTHKKGGHFFGASLLLAYQTFEAKGLSNFASLKASAGDTGLTNQGEDDAFGAGLRLGWLGKFDNFQLGAAYSTKIYMSEFDKYNELFAEQGDFDIPANWSLGLAYIMSKKVTLVTDIQGIQYKGIKSISNPGPTTVGGNPLADGQGLLGTDNGLGFGWKNMLILKFAALYSYDEKLSLRAGISHGEQPIPEGQVTFNILAPAVVQTHLALGLSYQSSNKIQYHVAYNYAFNNKVRGDFPQAFGGTPGTDQVTLEMQQHALEAGLSWRF